MVMLSVDTVVSDEIVFETARVVAFGCVPQIFLAPSTRERFLVEGRWLVSLCAVAGPSTGVDAVAVDDRGMELVECGEGPCCCI